MSYSSFQPFVNPRPAYVDDNGNPIVGATLTFYASGTSTLFATYADAALVTPNPNPMVSGEDGRFGPIYMQTGNYRVVFDSNGATAPPYDADPVQGNFWGAILPILNNFNQSVKYQSGSYNTIASDTNKTIAMTSQTSIANLAGASGNGWNVTVKNAYFGLGIPVVTTVNPPGGTTIDGQAGPYTITGYYAAANFILDGTNFLVRNTDYGEKTNQQLFTSGRYDGPGGVTGYTISVPGVLATDDCFATCTFNSSTASGVYAAVCGAGTVGLVLNGTGAAGKYYYQVWR